MSKGKFTSTNQPGDHLTPQQVAECRKLHGEGWSQVRLARRFQRSLTSIYKIVNYLSYSQIAIVETAPRVIASADALAESAARLAGFQQMLDQQANPPEINTTALMEELERPTGSDRELQPDEIWDDGIGRIRKRTPYDQAE